MELCIFYQRHESKEVTILVVESFPKSGTEIRSPRHLGKKELLL